MKRLRTSKTVDREKMIFVCGEDQLVLERFGSDKVLNGISVEMTEVTAVTLCMQIKGQTPRNSIT